MTPLRASRARTTVMAPRITSRPPCQLAQSLRPRTLLLRRQHTLPPRRPTLLHPRTPLQRPTRRQHTIQRPRTPLQRLTLQRRLTLRQLRRPSRRRITPLRASRARTTVMAPRITSRPPCQLAQSLRPRTLLLRSLRTLPPRRPTLLHP